MKAKFSPLDIEKFELLKSTYEFIVPKAEEVDVHELFRTYSVQIDFNHFEKKDEDFIQVIVKIEVNDLKQPKEGYRLNAEALGVFRLENNDLEKNVVYNLKYYSTLNMMINNLRNVMFQTSNIGPMGGYMLPVVDIADLFRKKQKQSSK